MDFHIIPSMSSAVIECSRTVVDAADNERSRLPLSEPAHTWYLATPAYWTVSGSAPGRIAPL